MRYKIVTIEVFEDYEQHLDPVFCRSRWLFAAYKRAFCARYGDGFRFRLYHT